jgi:hypothetical protein
MDYQDLRVTIADGVAELGATPRVHRSTSV